MDNLQNVWASGDWWLKRISPVGRKLSNRDERVLLNSLCPQTNTNVRVGGIAVHLRSLLAILIEFFPYLFY